MSPKNSMNNFLRDFFYHPVNIISFVSWVLRGKEGYPPHIAKVRRINEIQNIFQYDTFIETGTYMGDMINAQKKNFSVLHTIEFSHDLAERARRKFKHNKNIHVYEGDSGKVLREIMHSIMVPSVFWLDAHYSGGVTKKGDLDTPIIAELRAICRSNNLPHVILIDDARLFTGKKDYPTIKAVVSLVRKYRKKTHVYVKDDIVHIFI